MRKSLNPFYDLVNKLVFPNQNQTGEERDNPKSVSSFTLLTTVLLPCESQPTPLTPI